MSTANEQRWERLGRMIGGWALALLVIWKYPVPPDGIEIMEATVRWGFLALLIALGIGMAHSTVFGIVLGYMGRWYSFLRRGKRNGGPVAPTSVEGGTRVQSAVTGSDKKQRGSK